jgi:hypothetical protein
MIKLGFHHNGRPSARALAAAADVAPNAALRVIFRENYGEATVVALGRALRDAEFVSQWVGDSAGDEYDPPVEARRLTSHQRALVDGIIREMTKEVSSAGRRSKAQKTPEQKPGGQEGGSDDVASEAEKSGGRGSVTQLPERRYPRLQQRAARHGELDISEEQRRQDQASEESQDPGDWDDPA